VGSEKKNKYLNGTSFRTALKDRVRRLWREQGQEPEDTYKKLAFDRFLSRLDYNYWTLKGGFSLERRYLPARKTQDIDLAANDVSLLGRGQDEQVIVILSKLRSEMVRDLHDYFTFDLEPIKPLDGFGKGGVRLQVIAKIDDRVITTFEVDVVIQNKSELPRDTIKGSGLLSFADIETPVFLACTKEEIFAEKFHAYTRTYETENTRVKDLADMVKLSEDGLDTQRLTYAIKRVFTDRSTHSIPEQFPVPSVLWNTKYALLAQEYELSPDIEEATKHLKRLFRLISNDLKQ